jgi:nucleotidyltransferase substrate binding protein (TIGR01987 family)
MKEDIRWHQRFSNYRKALRKLNQAVEVIRLNMGDEEEVEEDKEAIDEMLKEGLIQRFEYTHELAWNVMKDFAEYQGNTNIKGSRDATREAFKMGLITKADEWMDMLKSRNDTSHTYNSDTADEIYNKIVNTYQALFIEFEGKMEALRSGTQSEIFDQEL